MHKINQIFGQKRFKVNFHLTEIMDCSHSQAPLNNSECCGYWKYSFACMSGVASINLNQPQLNDLSSSTEISFVINA